MLQKELLFSKKMNAGISAFTLTHHGPLNRIELISINKVTGIPAQVCVYRIGNTLIDTGSPHTIAALLDSQEKDPPKRIILSHQHEDHMGGVAALCRAFGDIPVYCPAAHTNIVSMPYAVPAYRDAHWGTPEPYAAVISYNEEEIFEEKDVLIKPLLTPGHTPGHMSFFIQSRKDRFILPGDLYLGPTCFMAFAECSVPDFIHSLELLLGYCEHAIGLPSHGGILLEPERAFRELLDWYRSETEVSMQTAKQIGSSDYTAVFNARFGKLKAIEIFSRGELSRLAHLRGIFEPVRSLPAIPIIIP